MPPSKGPMLILPLSLSHTGDTLHWSLASGASLLGVGPTPGSLVVYGERTRLSATAWQHFSIIVAAPNRLCGASQRLEEREWNWQN